LASVASYISQISCNKRVAFAGLIVFLALNGLDLTATPEDVIAFIYGHLETGTFRKDVLDTWLRAHTGPLQD